MIKINTSTQRVVLERENKILLIFQKTHPTSDSMSSTVLEVKSMEDLRANYVNPQDSYGVALEQLEELHTAEYLVRAGMNLVILNIGSSGNLESDLKYVEDVENLGYRIVLVPSIKYTPSMSTNTGDLGSIIKFLDHKDIELYINTDDIVTMKPEISPKVSIFFGYGDPTYVPYFSYPDGFKGIALATAVAVRKIVLIENGTPFIPVAGELTGAGVVSELKNIRPLITTIEKETLQSNCVNPIIVKRGVGNLIVAQNTTRVATTPRDPLVRGHATTLTLYIKNKLKEIGEKYTFLLNNRKTWELIRMEIEAFLDDLYNKGGLEEKATVQVGLNETMTPDDVRNGLLIINISFLPAQVIENIVINLVIREDSGTYDVSLIDEGGII